MHTPLLPLMKYGRLPYMEYTSFSTGAIAANAHVFSANGLFDPDITAAGHQPMGFDQMMLFYEHYTVTKAKLTVNFWNLDVDDYCMVGIVVAPDATPITNIQRLNENGMYVKKQIHSNNGAESNYTTCSCSVNISRINGKKDVKSENDFRGDVASNPVEQTYFHIFAYNWMTVAIIPIYFEVLIEYDAVFTEPRKMTQS